MKWPWSLWLVVSLVPAASLAQDAAAWGGSCPRPEAPPAFLLRDIRPGPQSSGASYFSETGGTFLFAAYEDSLGYEPWVSDGTSAGTHLLRDFLPGPAGGFPTTDDDYNTTVAGGDFFLPANDGVHGVELWTTDGTASGTRLVKDINPGPGSSKPSFLLNLGSGSLLFRADDGVHGWEPWLSHGMADDTELLKDIFPGPEGSGAPFLPVRVGGRAYFLANDGTHGGEPWVTDGTAAGTRLVADIRPGPEPSVAIFFTPFRGRVVFQADDGTHGTELWVTDGTEEGTRLLKDILPGSSGSNPRNFEVAGGRVFFSADDGVHGTELWVTDGTEEGTRLVRDIRPGGLSGFFSDNIVSFGRTVFFGADDGEHGAELWRSDGTEQGTVMVRDINPGPASAFPFYPDLFATGERLLFGADNGVTGVELWRSDGTERGTVLLQDIRPGPEGSSPRGFIQSAGRIIFIADDGEHGEEPWGMARSVLNDLRPPRIDCPDTVEAVATSASGATVRYPPARAEDRVTRCPVIRYSQVSGSVFPIGTTRVTATATDTAGNSASCTFKVKVRARR